MQQSRLTLTGHFEVEQTAQSGATAGQVGALGGRPARSTQELPYAFAFAVSPQPVKQTGTYGAGLHGDDAFAATALHTVFVKRRALADAVLADDGKVLTHRVTKRDPWRNWEREQFAAPHHCTNESQSLPFQRRV